MDDKSGVDLDNVLRRLDDYAANIKELDDIVNKIRQKKVLMWQLII